MCKTPSYSLIYLPCYSKISFPCVYFQLYHFSALQPSIITYWLQSEFGILAEPSAPYFGRPEPGFPALSHTLSLRISCVTCTPTW